MASPANRVLSCVGCLVAAPLGCMAFLGGGAAVGTYYMPELFADFLEEDLPQGFDEALEGELDIGSFDLSWTRDQRIDDLVVRDPEGREVLRADVRLPSLLRIMDEEEDLGEIHVELELHLVADESGLSNLQRAFRRRSGEPLESGPREWARVARELLFARRGSLRIDVRELELVTERSVERGEPIRVTNATADVEFGPESPIRVTALGATGRGSLALEAAARRAAFGPGPDPGVTGELSATGVPTELVASLVGSGPLLARAFGDEMDAAFSLATRDPDAPAERGAPFRAELRSERLRVSCEGDLASHGLLSGRSRAHRLAFDVAVHRPPLCEPWLLDLPAELSWRGEEPVRIRGVDVVHGPDGASLASGALRAELPAFELAPTRGGRFACTGADVDWRLDPDGGTERIDLEVELAEAGSASVRLAFPPGELPLLRETAAPFELSAGLTALDAAELDRALGCAGELAALTDGRLDLKLELVSSAERAPLALSLRGGDLFVELEGTLAGSPLDAANLVAELDGEASLAGVPAGSLLRLVGLDPGDVELDWDASEAPVVVAFEGWRPRRARDEDPAPPGPPGARTSRPGPREGGSLSLVVPRLALRDPELLAGDQALVLADVSFSASGDRDSLRVDLTADLAGGAGRVQGIGTLYGLRGPFGLAGAESVVVRVSGEGFPTALVDAELETRGLVGAALGEPLTIDYRGSGANARTGRFELDLSGPRGSVEVDGFREGAQVRDAELVLAAELDEGSVARLVRPLAPFVERVLPLPGGGVLALRLERAVLPLDGDLAVLAGRAVIDPRPARLVLDPEFLAFLADGERWRPAECEEPLVLELGEGRVRLEEQTIPVGRADVDHAVGIAIPLSGSYGFGGADLELQTVLPLHAVGSDVNPILVGLREYLRPDMDVPIVISGEPGGLSSGIRPQWIKTVSDVLAGMVPDVVRENLKRLLESE